MGTTDATFVVKMMLEKIWEWGINNIALFIDFEKAFDRVDKGSLCQMLQDPHYGIPIKLVRVIWSMYEDSTSKIVTQGIRGSFKKF